MTFLSQAAYDAYMDTLPVAPKGDPLFVWAVVVGAMAMVLILITLNAVWSMRAGFPPEPVDLDLIEPPTPDAGAGRNAVEA